MLTYALAAELDPIGIGVNASHSGATETTQAKADSKEIATKTDRRNWAADISLGHVASPDDVAATEFFLVSDLASP